MKLSSHLLLLFIASLVMAITLTPGKASTCYSATGNTVKECKEKITVVENNNEDLKSQLLFKY